MTENFLSASQKDQAFTGAYSPFRVQSYYGEMIKGITTANGSILRSNIDGSQLELVAWGLRNRIYTRYLFNYLTARSATFLLVI